jgi:hypothetical protein
MPQLLVYAHYDTKDANGHWSEDSGTTHAVSSFGPRTICGVPINNADDGWRRLEVRHADASTVECRRCRRTLRH